MATSGTWLTHEGCAYLHGNACRTRNLGGIRRSLPGSLLKSQAAPWACLAGQAGIWDDSVLEGFERMGGGLLDGAVGQVGAAGGELSVLGPAPGAGGLGVGFCGPVA